MLINNFSILYVEDNIEAQSHVKMIIGDDVKSFYQAFDGEEGLKLYKKFKPDIVLTDINMPMLNGLKMLHKIKNINKYQSVVIISAFDDKKTLLEAVNIGVDSFVPKPIDIEVLYEKLNIISKNLQNELDIENAKKKEIDYLYNLAHYDTLTKLPNRFMFNEKLDQVISKAKRDNSVFTLCFIDLDDFKNINDTYGHIAGDNVLQSVSKNIKKVIRVEDTFARISGDEFALIIEGVDDKIFIERLVDKIIKVASSDIEFENKSIKISCSIGISRFPCDSNDKNELIHFADISMYKVKELGKSSYSFYNN